jgi:predicted dehydrogenase
VDIVHQTMDGYDNSYLRTQSMNQHFRVAGISFEHMHMGDNLRMAAEHDQCQVVAVCDGDRSRMLDVQKVLGLDDSQLFTDWMTCVEMSRPDFIVLCPATGDHALWVERLAPLGLPLLIEKPFAASLADADRMIEACQRHDVTLAINWPLVWVPSHRTTKRLIDQSAIGEVLEVHYYNGNRGPLWHTAEKREVSAAEVQLQKPHSWFYNQQRGGGSLLDYLGYGATLGTWFMQGRKPIEITAMVDQPDGLEVDEHSIVIARYATGLSKFETRWGTFTDPWIHQPQPKCGFVIVGSAGTISSYDYADTIRVQTNDCPGGKDIEVDPVEAPYQNPLQYFVHCLEHGHPIEGPLSPNMSRIGQQIVDTAYASAKEKKALPLL